MFSKDRNNGLEKKQKNASFLKRTLYIFMYSKISLQPFGANMKMKNSLFASKKIQLLFLLSLVTATLVAQDKTFQLSPLFQDNMVLQQHAQCPVWGKGIPGMMVFLQTSWGKQISTIVQADSSWTLKLPTPKAGGPFQISLRHGKLVSVIRNVLVGEVWLCSGQSNMEMPLEGWPPSNTITNSDSEIDQALYPTIRVFTVMRSYEASPSKSCVGSWTEMLASRCPQV